MLLALFLLVSPLSSSFACLEKDFDLKYEFIENIFLYVEQSIPPQKRLMPYVQSHSAAFQHLGPLRYTPGSRVRSLHLLCW